MSTRSFRWLRPVPRLLLTPIGLLLLVSGVGLCLALVLGSQDVLIIFGLLLSAAIVVLGLAQVFAMPPNLPFLPRTIGTARLVWLLRFLLGTIVVVASGYIGAWSSIYLSDDLRHRQASGSFELLLQILAIAISFGSLILLGIYCFDLVRAKPPSRARALEAIARRGDEGPHWIDRLLARRWLLDLSSNEFVGLFWFAGFVIVITVVTWLGRLAAALLAL